MPSLPVEVCQTILRHSIYIPGFFDLDAFEGDLMAHGFGNPGAGQAEKSYWRAEKTRNILRRVCWSWNEYLLGFEHRFVSMSDVMHGRVDKTFLKKAMRISLIGGYCFCTDICIVPSLDDPDGHRHVYPRFAKFCNDTIFPFGFLPAEIVEIDTMLTHERDVIDVMPVLTRAKVLISSGVSVGSSRSLLTETANLEHIRGYIYENPHLVLTAQNLVTVSFEWDRENTPVLELPSLRHLGISYGYQIASSEYFGPALTSLLHIVGDQLRSLYIDSREPSHQIQADIWDTCPKLEKFHPGPVLAVSPPMSHPLHTLSVLPQHLSHAATLQFPNLRRLILDGHGRKIDLQGVTDLISIRTTSLIDTVTVEDYNGVQMTDVPEDTDTALREN